MLNKCKKILVKEAPLASILAAHSQDHIDRLESTQYDPAMLIGDEGNGKPLSEYTNTYRF